jgi:DNA-binding transcriptional LysR family regulator
MHVTQPAVAEQIRQLERYLRVDLFVRLGRGLRLTAAGEEFLLHAQRVVAAAEEAQNSVAQMRSLLGGTVTFGTFGAPAHYGFADLIRRFAEDYPAVKLRLRGRNSCETANAVRAGDLEAALVVLPIDDDCIKVRPIARDEVLFASANATLTCAPKTVSQFAASPLVLYEAQYATDDPTRRQLSERAQASGIPLNVRFEVEHLDTALQLASAGLANTYVPRAVTRSAIFPPNLTTCPFDPPVYDTFAVITRRRTNLSPATAQFVNLLTRHMCAVVAAPEMAGELT